MKRGSGSDAWGARAWYAVLVTVAVAPLLVSKLPFIERPFTYTPFVFPQTIGLMLGAAIALALWCISLLAGRALRWSPWLWATVGFALWASVATAVGYEPLRSLLGSSTSSLSLVIIIAAVALTVVAVQLLDSKNRLLSLTWAVVASGVAVATIALIQQLFGVDPFGMPGVQDWFLGRGFSTIGNPDHLGTFLVLPTVLAAALALLTASARSRRIALACLLLLATAAVGTLSRGTWIAIGFGLLALALVAWLRRASFDGRSALMAGAAVVLAVMIAVLASQGADLKTRFGARPESVGTTSTNAIESANVVSSSRIDVWRCALAIVADRPVTGTGPAAFQLGWYPNAVNPRSEKGTPALVDDPHSLLVAVLATTGVPGLLLYAAAIGAALFVGVRQMLKLVSDAGRPMTDKALAYSAWVLGTICLQIALLVAAVTPVIALYAFLTLGVLMSPSASEKKNIGPARLALPALALTVAVAIAAASILNLGAEVRAESALKRASLLDLKAVANANWWNFDLQKIYYAQRSQQIDGALLGGASTARADLDAIVAELEQAHERAPREYYYPSVSALLLTRGSELTGDRALAERAVAAADEALAIMPSSLPTRVQKALALSDLGRYPEMVETLESYWKQDVSYPYPGIVYAQALALSGRGDDATAVFDYLQAAFPGDGSIEAAREQAKGFSAQ